MTDDAARLEFAAELAIEAGRLAARMRTSLGPIETKGALDFCTEADRASETLIRGRIADRYGEAVIGEEFGGGVADPAWVVDPIDGTSNFILGSPRWCVSIGWVSEGMPRVGVIYAPMTDRLFAARHGGGAWLNGRRMSVSHLAHGGAPVVETGRSNRRPLPDYLALLARLIDAGIDFRRRGSGALGMAETACGLHDGYVEQHINAWDVMAGILLVQEAGGWTNDFLADDGMTRGNPIIACTPEIREALERLAPPA